MSVWHNSKLNTHINTVFISINPLKLPLWLHIVEVCITAWQKDGEIRSDTALPIHIRWCHHGPNIVIGTTYTPSGRIYAEDDIPHITQRNSGGTAFSDSSNIPLIFKRFLAAQVLPQFFGPSMMSVPYVSRSSTTLLNYTRKISIRFECHIITTIQMDVNLSFYEVLV